MREYNEVNSAVANQVILIPERAIVNSLFSSCGCHENEVILCGDPGTTARSKADGSTSSLPTIVCCMSCKCITELSLCKEPKRLCLQ